jgi:hypothetical protein
VAEAQENTTMGYTHYWNRAEQVALTPELLADVRTVLRVVGEQGIPLCFEYDRPGELPAVNEELIRFNGQGEDGHETFLFEAHFQPSYRQEVKPGKLFDFCKTARKPYDLAVCAVLIVLKHHLGDQIEVSSDGDVSGTEWSPEEWEPAVKLVQQHLGYGADFKLDND